MSSERKLLVVDDELVICQACRRIFSQQGFRVEESTDAREGLKRATENDYAVILLDIKMPHLDGIQFLEQLREKKPDMPVLIMTGYPSVPNAAAAVRLGASDYITKPFTPELITQSVQRILARTGISERAEGASAASEAESPMSGTSEVLFLDESWLQLEPDGSATVGAVLAPLEKGACESVRLPRIGEVVYQGLPLASLALAAKPPVTVPSPISGVVVAVNERLTKDPGVLWSDPCREGWIACVCTTRAEEELDQCRPRRVILLSADPVSAQAQCRRLTSLGCQVHVAGSWDELSPALEDPKFRGLMFDAASFGPQGPEMVGRLGAAAPSMRIVVVASTASQPEAAYREHKIFYYAVEPFADREIVDVLDGLFRQPEPPLPRAPQGKAPPEYVHGIRITNRNGHKVHLLAGPRLLQRGCGLGWLIAHKLAARKFPMQTTPGDAGVTTGDLFKAAGACDRLMVLEAKDTGRLPGSLVRDMKPELLSESGGNGGNITTIAVQPGPEGTGFGGLDARTTAALAEHIVEEMASY
jgi:DNA-binding response OmpR family regulator